MSAINDSTLSLLERGLTVSLTRQNLLASNVANLDTPGFVPADVDFEGAMQAASRAGANRTARIAARHTSASPDRAPGVDGNAVDLDVQMGRIAQNNLLYGATTRAVSKKLALLRYVISEGGL
ncbi:MAG: flagellar basal body rod protein FlgB [Myxococcales bacterium]|nr:flagellar basal body rod protein FlgB [Myxococcales bacterium]